MAGSAGMLGAPPGEALLRRVRSSGLCQRGVIVLEATSKKGHDGDRTTTMVVVSIELQTRPMSIKRGG